jgi:hypothetical protein
MRHTIALAQCGYGGQLAGERGLHCAIILLSSKVQKIIGQPDCPATQSQRHSGRCSAMSYMKMAQGPGTLVCCVAEAFQPPLVKLSVVF